MNPSPKKTLLCIPIVSDNYAEVLKDLKEAEEKGDITELRLDCVKDLDETKLEIVLKSKNKPMIVTYMGKSEHKTRFIKKAIECKVEFVDIDFEDKESVEKIPKDRADTKVIISYHNFDETPNINVLNETYKKIKSLNADLIKIVTMARSINDNFIIFDLLQGKNDLISFCMGLKGQISRVLAWKYGSAVSYACLSENKKSAPGQMTVKDLEVYRFKKIFTDTEVVGVIGEFAENSQSKNVHNPWFEGLNFVFVPFKTEKKDLDRLIKNIKKRGICGAAVTIPYKEEVMKFLDEIDDTAEKIGAVNTIVNGNGRLIGYNTDQYGAIRSLRNETDLENKKVLLLGAGGAARSIAYGLKKENANVTVVNRSIERAEKISKEFDVNFARIEKLKELVEKNEIIINSTSIGIHPHQEDSIVEEINEGKIVMDVVYNPRITKLIRIAMNNNCKTITGENMLVYQAVKQFKLWTGKNVKIEDVENARKLLW